MERDWENLPLREYRPDPMLRVGVHEILRAAAPVVDAHNHLGRRTDLTTDGTWLAPDVGALVAFMDEANVQTIVNLDGDWGETLEANLERYDRAHPGRFATFCRLNWDRCQEPGWPDVLANSLQDSVERGATGLKIWKDVGLHVRDETGALVLCDDERLGPVWDVAAADRLPVLVRTADPPAFFEPLSERNERLEELIAHPDWHFAGPEFPRFQVLIDALEHLVATRSDVTFIGAHVGSNAEDLAWVGRMFDTCPNFYVDVAARVADLGRQPRATRRLVFRHQTRVLFGTDAFPPTRPALSVYFRFFETDDEHFPCSPASPPPNGRWAISGLALPDDVLADVYGANARRILKLPGAV